MPHHSNSTVIEAPYFGDFHCRHRSLPWLNLWGFFFVVVIAVAVGCLFGFCFPIVNLMTLLISFSGISSLGYKTARDFCMLIL